MPPKELQAHERAKETKERQKESQEKLAYIYVDSSQTKQMGGMDGKKGQDRKLERTPEFTPSRLNLLTTSLK